MLVLSRPAQLFHFQRQLQGKDWSLKLIGSAWSAQRCRRQDNQELPLNCHDKSIFYSLYVVLSREFYK